MASLYLVLLPLSVVLIFLFRRYQALQCNIAIAKASGLPYIVTPWNIHCIPWLVIEPTFLSHLTKRIPALRNSILVKVMYNCSSWRSWRDVHDALGDVYMVVSPHDIYVNTTNAEFSSQITNRKVDFPKPVAEYTAVTIFGNNMLCMEGEDWKRHRKIVAPSFSERSNALVWEDAIRQMEGLLKLWGRSGSNTTDEIKVENTDDDWAMLALHVISAAGFGIPQTWPGEGEASLGKKVVPGFNTEKLYNNHTLTFKESLHGLGLAFIWLFAVSPKTLASFPFKRQKKMAASFFELKQYLSELVQYKKQQIDVGERDEGTMDLLGPLIQASELAAGGANGKSDEKSLLDTGALTQDEIVGNAFVFMFAGHETAAGTIHFSVLFLAMHLADQVHLQADIDRIVGTRDPSSWTYQTDLGNLYNSMVGAVQNEELRLIPAVICPPKRVSKSSYQNLTMDGKTITLPPNALIHLNAVGSGRNPRYWPHSPSKISGKPHDLDDFIPSRWIVPPAADSDSTDPSIILKPAKGVFLPFSEGARACPGRRFAQVEITAVLSVLFQKFSVELDVGRWASDEEVACMGFEERKAVYAKARERADRLIRESVSIITLKMRGENVPVRVVRRGKERFKGC